MAGGSLRVKAAIRKQFGATSPIGRRHDDDRCGRRESAPGVGLHRQAQGHGWALRCWSKTRKQDAFSGHLFAFRGKRARIIKILFWSGNGLSLFTKRTDRSGFVWPRMVGYEGSITLSPAQLAMLIEGIDWRAPERVWRPVLAN